MPTVYVCSTERLLPQKNCLCRPGMKFRPLLKPSCLHRAFHKLQFARLSVPANSRCGRTKVRRTLYVALEQDTNPFFPRRLLHPVLRREHYSSIILFRKGLIPPLARPRKMHFQVLRVLMQDGLQTKCDETLSVLVMLTERHLPQTICFCRPVLHHV